MCTRTLKKGYTEAQQHIQDLKHISDFKELPNADVQLTQQTFNDAMVKAPLVSNMLFVCLFVCSCFVCLFVLGLFVCLFVCLFLFCLFVCLFVSLFLCFFVCLFVCLFLFCLFVCSCFVCLFVCSCLFVCFYVLFAPQQVLNILSTVSILNILVQRYT